MARVKKTGVDYFSHDVDASSRRTLATLEAHFGNDGYAFWFKLLEMLGQQKDLYIDFSDELQWVYFVARAHIDEARGMEIMNFLARLRAVDAELWHNHKIVWVQNFVERLGDVFKKRRQDIPEKPYFNTKPICTENNSSTGISVTEITAKNEQFCPETAKMPESGKNGLSNSPENDSSTGIFGGKNTENDSSAGISVTESTQSKVKKSKVNNTTTTTTNARAREDENLRFPGKKYNADIYDKAFTIYSQCIEEISSSGLKEFILALVDDVGIEVFTLAVEKALKNGVRKFAYVESTARGILKDRAGTQKGGEHGRNKRRFGESSGQKVETGPTVTVGKYI